MITPQDLISLFRIGYLLVAVLVLIAAVRSKKKPEHKGIAALVVIVLFAIWPIATNLRVKEEKQVRMTKLDQAMALYNKHCESAGEKIYKTVDNVEGLLLMKVRPEGTNYGDQFAMTDPYGDDTGGDGYIKSFLYGRDKEGHIDYQSTLGGFRYVDAVDPQDGRRYRYTGDYREVMVHTNGMAGGSPKSFKSKEFVLDRITAKAPLPRYGVTYDDISTREDREHWIAGSSLRVIDLQTNEVIAERIGYMIDRAQGSTAGDRSPWLFAKRTACPAFPSIPGQPPRSFGQARIFVEKVLHPKK